MWPFKKKDKRTKYLFLEGENVAYGFERIVIEPGGVMRIIWANNEVVFYKEWSEAYVGYES